MHREFDCCVLVFGMVRYCAYKIAILAEKERLRHIKKGTWDGKGDDINQLHKRPQTR
jgi:hypothetical protein